MRLLDLFSGIGGFSLGLERAGFQTVAFCEIEPYPRAVLRKHWPNVPCYEDIRTLTAERLKADGIAVDAICGGFPCQDISTAGKGAGIEGERSGLWREYARLIGELRPRYVIVENVAALLGRGLSRVLGDLAALRYDAEWHCIPASAVGAPHRRDRLWIVAYPNNYSRGNVFGIERASEEQYVSGKCGSLQERADTYIEGLEGSHNNGQSSQRLYFGASEFCENVADTASLGQSGSREPGQRRGDSADGERQANIPISIRIFDQWAVEPDVGRVANGVPSRVDRLKGLGNAVVPQIPEIIGRAIINAERGAEKVLAQMKTIG